MMLLYFGIILRKSKNLLLSRLSTGKQICSEANVNYLSFRSAKYGCHLPSVSTIVQLSAFFNVSIESLVCDCCNEIEERRNRILDAVIKSKPSRYIALESLLGLSSPEIEDIE